MSEPTRSPSGGAGQPSAWSTAAAASAFTGVVLAGACGGDTAVGPGNGGSGGDAGTLNLAVGESQVVEGGSRGLSFSLPAPGEGGAEYRLAVQSAAREAGATGMRLSVSSEGGSSSATAPASRRLHPEAGPAGWRVGEPTPWMLGEIARSRLQEQTREMLRRRGVRAARRGPGDGGVSADRSVSAQLDPGEMVSLSFPIFEESEGNPRSTCDTDTAQTVTAEVKAVGTRAAMLEDTATSAVGSADMDYQSLATEFDDFVFGVDVAYFGTPTDIDGNGHVMVLFSPKVNDLSAPNSQAIITGLFNAVDLADNGDGQGSGTATGGTCPAGNEGELLYMVAPDPGGNHDAGAISASQAETIARSTSSHEFQHLLNAANRVIKQSGDLPGDLEVLWLNEALSHLAEEIVGFAKSGLAVRANHSAPDAGSGQGGQEQQTFNTFHASNLTRLAEYLGEPASTQAVVAGNDPGGTESLKLRGFAWIFARWLADQEFSDTQGQVPGTGDPEESFFRQLAKADGQNLDAGIENVEGVTGREWADLLGEFAPMPAVDDDVQNLAGSHRLLTWNLRQIYQTYPLSSRSIGFTGNTLDFSVEAGAEKYVFIGSSGSASGVAVELTDQTGSTLTAGSPQITVVRTR